VISEVYVSGKRIGLDPTRSIGIGGEAEIFNIGSDALKVYKTPDHPDYKNPDGSDNLTEQDGARERLQVHQQKLPALVQLASQLPDRVITPRVLGTDRNGQLIVGYTMRRLDNVEPILQFSKRDFHDKGLSNEIVTNVFRELHGLISGGHSAGFLVGDFNPLNVLVDVKWVPYIIDVDSGQFDKFLCKVYTERYVDPLLGDPNAKAPSLSRPYNTDSDWYSFAVMLFTSLLCVSPYGGVYKPRRQMTLGTRTLQRIPVFDPDVIYPKASIAFHFGVLPDDLLQYLYAMFKKDKRGPFPIKLLEDIRWTKCTVCGLEHARARCPSCDKAPPTAIKEVTVVRGKVKATRIFKTSGLIVFADCQNGKLLWLHHEGNKYKRESGKVVAEGSLNARLRFRIQGDRTLIGQKGAVVTIPPGSGPAHRRVDNYVNLPIFDANQSHVYWADGGRLERENTIAPKHIGNVLAGQTLFWVGPTFGFGFYRAGSYNVAFVFDAERTGINDTVKIPPIRGQLIDSTCFFTKKRCWFLVATQEGGKTIHRCTIIRSDGSVEATAEAEAGDGSWLSQLRGKCALGRFLFVATDSGIIRVEPDNGRIVKSGEFPDTEQFVDSGCHLFPGEGIYVVDQHEIRLLQIG